MCGFIGVFRPTARGGDSATDEQKLRALLPGVSHRGPDDASVMVSGPLVLGATRLAMIDAQHGSQPMMTSERRVVGAFNGEIYRHRVTRESLTRRGYRFKTPNSDTETFLALLSQHGVRALSQLDAQYSASAYFLDEQKLVLVRDRFGIHPLFYTEKDGAVYFGSSARMVAALAGGSGISAFATYMLLALWGLPDPLSPFEHVQSVRPGYAIEFVGGRTRHRAVDPIVFPSAGEEAPLDRDALQSAFDEAVDARLEADARLAILLSGGVDSAAVAQAARQASYSLPCYRIAGVQDDHAEATTAAMVAASHSHDLNVVTVTSEDLAAALPSTVAGCEAPFWRTGPIGFEMLATRMSADGIKGILTGDGADELFCGYDLFRITLARIAIGSGYPQAVARGTDALRGISSTAALMKHGRLPLALTPFVVDDDLLYSHSPRWRLYSAAALRLFTRDMQEHIRECDAIKYMRDCHGSDLEPLSPMNRARLLELRTLFQGFLISTQSDRPFMHHGVEGRYPFLSRKVADIAIAANPADLVSLSRAKLPVREQLVARTRPTLTSTPKRAYDPGSPLSSAGFRALCDQHLDPDLVRQGGIFDHTRVTGLLEATLSKRRLRDIDVALLLGVVSTQILLSVSP